MKICFLGDSITWGAGASKPEKRYYNVVGSLLKADVKSYGEGGTRFARQDTGNYLEDFNKRAVKMEKDADYVFVFGGTNDFGHGISQIGDKESKDVYTFCGGINFLIDYLIEVYGKEKIVFILPLRCFHENNPRGEGFKEKDGLILKEYVNIEKDILEKRGIAYIDLFNMGLPKPEQKTNEFFVDGLHPNDLGHFIIAQNIVAYLQRMEYETKNKKD